MTKIKLYLLIFMGFALFSTACEDDPAEPDRDKFLGAFSVVETCGGGNDSYDITLIESGSSDDAVILINLYDAGEQISATVSGNSITIPNQTEAIGITYSGSGTISDNTLTINFTVSAQGASDNCNAVCTRK